jgi:hypothetical protein
MQGKHIILDFGSFKLNAELFDTTIARSFFHNLPYTIQLQQWGDELFGSIGRDFGEEEPVPQIPPGGIAYTNSGSYLCIFFGQTPAWPVEYIGQIKDDEWKRLVATTPYHSVIIEEKEL